MFDDNWHPSDALEDALSVMEADHAKLFERLRLASYTATADDRDLLCEVLALQATRHPDVLGRGHRRAKEMGALFSNVWSMSLVEFKNQAAGFGIGEAEANDCYVVLRTRPED